MPLQAPLDVPGAPSGPADPEDATRAQLSRRAIVAGGAIVGAATLPAIA